MHTYSLLTIACLFFFLGGGSGGGGDSGGGDAGGKEPAPAPKPKGGVDLYLSLNALTLPPHYVCVLILGGGGGGGGDSGDAGGKEPAPAPKPKGGVDSGAACSAHPACKGLSGDCCPTGTGIMLGCCDGR